MKRSSRFSPALGLSVVAVLGALGVIHYSDLFGVYARAETTAHSHSGMAGTDTSEPIVYYQHPDYKPLYSATPRKAEDGRDYTPVRAGADLSFDEKPVAPPKTDTGQERKILYYRNPMGLADTSPVPKKDSMGMDYIPVYDGEQEEAGIVKVSPGKVQRTGVKSDVAIKAAVKRDIRAPGTVQLDERRVSVVATRSDAFMESVADITTGDRVSKGQVLVKLYSPDIAAAGAQYVSELNNLVSGVKFLGSRQRLENLGAPASVIAEIEATRKSPISVAWTSPRDGVVLERNVVDGMKAAPGDVLFRIADLSIIWVLADIPEYEIGAVKIGDEAVIRARSFPERTFLGKVGLIYPQINKETRTTRVRIEIANPDGLLLPDMYADVAITTGRNEPVVTVPDNAIVDTGTRQIVILDKGEGRFEPRDVKVGRRGLGIVEILDGVKEGDKVVVSANFLIDAESNLKAALSTMTQGDATP